MKKTFIIIILLLFLIPIISIKTYGAQGEGGVTLPILNYIAGTRALGLGTAYTALSDEITSMYWNPAGLGRLRRQQVYAMYEKLYEGSTYMFAGYSLPFYGIGVFGVGMIYLTSGDIIGTGPNQEDIGVYSDTQSMVIVSYGTPIQNIFKVNSRHLAFLDIGISMKLIKHSIYEYTAYGMAFDIGTRYVPSKTIKTLRNFIFGLVIQNIMPPSNKLAQKREWYPLKLKMGTCYRTLYDTLLITLDVNQILFRKQSPEFNVGLEYVMLRMFRVRTGYKNGPSFGMGMEIEDFTFDYGLNYNFDMGTVHQFAISFKFGQSRYRRR